MMAEEKLLSELLENRISMLLSEQPEEVLERGRRTADMIEEFTLCLEADRKKQFEQMLDRIIMEDSEESRYLYLNGVKDGIRITRWLLKT